MGTYTTHYCDRCKRTFDQADLRRIPEIPGIHVCEKCFDLWLRTKEAYLNPEKRKPVQCDLCKKTIAIPFTCFQTVCPECEKEALIIKPNN